MRICQPFSKTAGTMSGVLLTALIFGCASGGSGTYSSAPAESSAAAAPGAQAASSNAESGFAGVWQGTTLASCAAMTHLPGRCDAEQIVTITLLQSPDGKFTGRYTCAYGNMDCYHANYTGKVINVTITGKRANIRVLMPDGTSCIYTGVDVNQAINGGYTCYQGGGLIEEGSWKSRRSY